MSSRLPATWRVTAHAWKPKRGVTAVVSFSASQQRPKLCWTLTRPKRPDHDGAVFADGKDIASAPTTSKRTRLNVCTRHDPLRVVLERLAMPSMRRVIVAHPDTGRVEAVVSLSDVARFLFM